MIHNSLTHPPELSPDWALFLDVDGTLVALADTPDEARPTADLLPVLKKASAALDGALALISGRELAGVDRLAPLLGPAAGMHGLERRQSDGTLLKISEPKPSLRAFAADLRLFEAENDGIICEDKGPTVTLHYRMAPDREAAARQLIERHRDNLKADYAFQEGKMMIEIKPIGATKAGAVKAFMQEAPFAGRRPVFVGDDITDEDGFRAVHELGGLSIWVSEDPQARPTLAQYHLSHVSDVIGWLNRIS